MSRRVLGEVCQYHFFSVSKRQPCSVTVGIFCILYHASAKCKGIKKKKKGELLWFTEPPLRLNFFFYPPRGPKYLNSMVEITEIATDEVTKKDNRQTRLSRGQDESTNKE